MAQRKRSAAALLCPALDARVRTHLELPARVREQFPNLPVCNRVGDAARLQPRRHQPPRPGARRGRLPRLFAPGRLQNDALRAGVGGGLHREGARHGAEPERAT
jgi:hypothetical protein